MDKTEFLKNSVIVAAHPDDELLWFGSILKDVDQVLVVFEEYWPDPSMGTARAEALANFPRDNVENLKFPEAATYGLGRWDNPVLSEFGLELSPIAVLRDMKQSVKRLAKVSRDSELGIIERYKANYKNLYAEMRERLTANMNVFTHNPWGEYGHEEHVQLFRVLDRLRREIGFKLWMSNYCSERALPLAMSYFDADDHKLIQLPVNKSFADSVANVYRDAGCWTWSDDWRWFDTEIFMEAPTNPVGVADQGHLFPLNFFNIEPTLKIRFQAGVAA